jgi:uncharacterized membrane protein
MSQNSGRWTDEQVEQVIGNLLRAGVLTAAAVVLAGGIIYLARHGGEPASEKYQVFAGEPADLRSPFGVVADVLAGKGRGIIQLGILLLIATPVARVSFSAYAFARERDFIYVVVTLIVLAVLLYSLLNSQV